MLKTTEEKLEYAKEFIKKIEELEVPDIYEDDYGFLKEMSELKDRAWHVLIDLTD